MSTELIVNFANPVERQLVLDKVRTLIGTWRINFTEHRRRRTDRQNRYYWPCFVQPFADFLRGQGQPITDDEAHELFKAKFLRRDIVNPSTGEVIGETVQSTTLLSTVEFNEYLDYVAFWLADMFDIIVPEPGVYRECEEAA